MSPAEDQPGVGPSDNAALERQKLLLEIRELNRSWWQKPAYIAAIAPFFLGVLTVTIGYWTGYFNAVSERLTAQRQGLEIDVKNFAQQKEQITAELKGLGNERDTMAAENARLKVGFEHERRQLSTEKANLERELALTPFRSDINRLIEQASRPATVADVQRMVTASLGGAVRPEIQETIAQISKTLSIDDKFRSDRSSLLKATLTAHPELSKMFDAAAAQARPATPTHTDPNVKPLQLAPPPPPPPPPPQQ
jgi:hypothetical protein